MNERKRGRRPKGHKRTKEQQEHDIAFCSDLFLRGYTYRQIAIELNKHLEAKEMGYTIAHTMVYYDIQQALIEWKRERFDNIDDYITQEIKKLDKMEFELWEAWESSKTGKERIKSRNSKKPNKVDAQVNEPDYYGYTENATETSSGNPQFLNLLLNVQMRRAKLLGYDAPIKVDVANMRPTENDKPKYDTSAIPDDVLFAMADKLQNAAFISNMQNKGKAIN